MQSLRSIARADACAHTVYASQELQCTRTPLHRTSATVTRRQPLTLPSPLPPSPLPHAGHLLIVPQGGTRAARRPDGRRRQGRRHGIRTDEAPQGTGALLGAHSEMCPGHRPPQRMTQRARSNSLFTIL
jgi:hypothetical protein